MNKKFQGLVVCTIGMLFLIQASSIGFASSTNFFRIQMESWFPYYVPEAPSVVRGTVVRWENPTATHHTVTHDGCRQGGTCLFDSGVIPPTGAYELPELPPGEYSYHCELHPIMRGTIVVTNNGEHVHSSTDKTEGSA